MTTKVVGKVAGKSVLVGNAGEFLVVGELLRRDVIAALAPRNAPHFDVLATNGLMSTNIRVKTKSSRADTWVCRVSAKEVVEHAWKRTVFAGKTARDFVVLVDLPQQPSSPRYFIVPTRVLEQRLQKKFKAVLEAPPTPGRPRNPDNWERRFGVGGGDEEWLGKFKDRWDYIVGSLDGGDK